MSGYKRILPPFLIITVIALAAFACQGVADLPNPFASATPTASATATATPTPRPTSTPTITATPRPSGMEAKERADGTTLFNDYDNQFQVVLPAGWIIIPLSGRDLAEILGSMADENADLEGMANAFGQMDPKVIRMIALNEDPKYITNGYGTNISILAADDKFSASLPLDLILGMTESSLKSANAKIRPGNEETKTNLNGLEYGLIDAELRTASATGGQADVRSFTIYFKSNEKLIVIALTTLKQFGGEFLPVVEEIISSIKLLKP